MSEAWAAMVVAGVILLLWRVQALQGEVRSRSSRRGVGSDLTVHVSQFLLESTFGTLDSRAATEPPSGLTACGPYLLPTKEERLEHGVILTSDTDQPRSTEPTCEACATLLREARQKQG